MPNRSSPSLQRHRLRRQRGVAMLFAIAIIVVASLLGAAMVRMLRVEQEGVARDVLSTRALLAADSAAQRALYQLFVAPRVACSAINTFPSNFAGVTGLNNCTASAACTPYQVPSSTTFYYSIRATGTCGPTNDPATRQVEVLARDI